MPLRCRPISTRAIRSGRQIVFAPHRDQRVDGGVGVAAARIGFDSDLHGFIGAAEAGDGFCRVGVIGVADQQPVLAFHGFSGSDKSLLGECRGDHAVHGGGADLVALVPGAVDQKLQRSGGLAAGDAERGDQLLFGQAEQLARGGSGAIGAGGRGGMEAACVVRGGIQRVAETAADFIAGDDRGEYLAAGCADHLADGKRCGHHRCARMQRRVRVGIIEVQRVAECAVQQRGDGGGVGLAVAEHGGVACAIHPQCRKHREDGGRGVGFLARTHGASQKVQRQHLGALQDVLRNGVECQVLDIGGQRRGFMCHFFVPLSWRHVKQPNRCVQAPAPTICSARLCEHPQTLPEMRHRPKIVISSTRARTVRC